ncbi:DUF5659 domain-containing protein [Ureibacillus chungkukjangi]|uniref:DUF5659 domain-containing protein n=1 Tax=Ureibacillus chungkukjangi TaxID=1202712 RepID=UPI003D81393B
MNKEYIVFSQKLAGELMIRGFVLKKLKKSNKNNSNKNIFIFNESDDLLKFIQQYKQNK